MMGNGNAGDENMCGRQGEDDCLMHIEVAVS